MSLSKEEIIKLKRYEKDTIEDFIIILNDALIGKELIKKVDVARLPISWYEVSQIEILGKTFALSNDKDDVYVTVDGKNIKGTKESTINLNYSISNLVNTILDYIISTLKNNKLTSKAFNEKRRIIVRDLRREYKPQLLIDLSNYFDDLGEKEIASKIDHLRNRLSRLKPDSQEVQGEV